MFCYTFGMKKDSKSRLLKYILIFILIFNPKFHIACIVFNIGMHTDVWVVFSDFKNLSIWYFFVFKIVYYVIIFKAFDELVGWFSRGRCWGKGGTLSIFTS